MPAGQYNTMTVPITDLEVGAFPDGQSVNGLPTTIAASGTTQVTAAALVPANAQSGSFFIVTGASGTNAVALPTPSIPGDEFLIVSSAATNALPIFPPVGGAINYGTVNASFSATAKTPYYAVALDTAGNYLIK